MTFITVFIVLIVVLIAMSIVLANCIVAVLILKTENKRLAKSANLSKNWLLVLSVFFLVLGVIFLSIQSFNFAMLPETTPIYEIVTDTLYKKIN